MKKTVLFGSPAWLEDVFRDPPARDVTGRSRPTQRYLVGDLAGKHSYAEGGNTAISRAILTTMQNAGVVRRFKLEPFRIRRTEHGIEAIPDILFQMKDGRVFVSEAKAAKYLTEEKLEACSAVERIVGSAGMKYLMWTDAWPLARACWQTMWQVRRNGRSAIPSRQLDAAVGAVQARPMTIAELRSMGIYHDAVFAAVWHGRVHMNLYADITDATLIGADPRMRSFEQTLVARVRSHSFWNSLTRF